MPRALVALATLAATATADLDSVVLTLPVLNPLARHVSFAVPANTPTVCTLAGHEDSSLQLSYYIVSLPDVGALYDTSQNYRAYSTDPKNSPVPIQAYQLPYLVTDTLHRVVYAPPANAFAPSGSWASFTYSVIEPVSGTESERGTCVLANGDEHIASSTFLADTEGWTLEGNVNEMLPQHQAYSLGALNRYIIGADDVQYVDFDTGDDRAAWYFVAPSKYLSTDLAAAYGGTLSFTVKATYGDFGFANSGLPWASIECASCRNGDGMRIVKFIDTPWDGREKRVELTLAPGHLWKKDPLNQALAFVDATECEIAAVLAGVTKVKILGDYTQAGEGIALDDVQITRAASQPAVSVACQRGCTCAHYSGLVRQSCCGV